MIQIIRDETETLVEEFSCHKRCQILFLLWPSMDICNKRAMQCLATLLHGTTKVKIQARALNEKKKCKKSYINIHE